MTIAFAHLGLYATVHAATVASANWEYVVFAGCLVAISIVDFERFEIPDSMLLGLVSVGLLRLLFDPIEGISTQVAGASAWSMLFWAVAATYRRRTGTDGLGFGDVKLVGALSLWVGYDSVAPIVLAASAAGVFSLLALRFIRTRQGDDLTTVAALAFGPYLCFSAWVMACSFGLT